MIGASVSVAAVVAALALLIAGAGAWAVRGDRSVAAARRVPGTPPVGTTPAWVATTLARLDVAGDPRAVWRAVRALGCVAAATLVACRPEVVLAVVPVGVGFGAIAAVVGALLRRRPGRAEVDAVAVVERLVAPLGSGASLARAVALAAGPDPAEPVGRALADLARAIDDGAGTQDAFDGWARRVGDGGLRLLADALAVAGVAGGSRVGALLGVGETLRERDALAREVRALGSQARASAAVLAATPPVFTTVVALADGRVATFLLRTPAGWACLAAGAAADGVGWWWMRRLLGAVS